jgi:hypothetical protein
MDQSQIKDCHLLTQWCIKSIDMTDYQLRRDLCNHLLEHYAHHGIIERIDVNPVIIAKRDQEDIANFEVCYFLFDWVFDDDDTNDEFEKIIISESILEICDRIDIEKFRNRVATRYFYRDIVHNSAPNGKSVEKLITKFPQFNRYIGNLYKNTNVFVERLKTHESIAPLFNGSGCVIL